MSTLFIIATKQVKGKKVVGKKANGSVLLQSITV